MSYGGGSFYLCHRRRIQQSLVIGTGAFFFLIWIIQLWCHDEDDDNEVRFALCWVKSIIVSTNAINKAAVNVERKNNNSLHIADDNGHLRAIAFGTSRTWGACLEDPNTQAYIKLLSHSSKNKMNTTMNTTSSRTNNTGINLGFRAGDADLPALCLYSMIQNYTANEDDTFDVIVLEFKADYALLPFQEKLLHRIRTRFPTALIVFVELRAPFFFQHTGTNQSIREWMTEHGYTSLQDEVFHQDLLQNTSSTDWINTAEVVDWKERHFAMLQGGAHYILSFPPNQPLISTQQQEQHQHDDTLRHSWLSSFRREDAPKKYQFKYYDARKFISLNAKYFCDDWSHPSKLGHEYIADRIRDLVAKTNVHTQVQARQKQKRTTRSSSIKRQQQQTEGDGHDVRWVGPKDQCNLWISDGILGRNIFENTAAASATTAVSRTVGMEFVEFDDWDHRFAAQVSQHGGSIQLHISIVPCDIFVSHMQIGPAVDQYPKTLAWLAYHDNDEADGITRTTTTSTPVVLDPFYEFGSHVTKVAYVGPGPEKADTFVTIHFKPIQEGMANLFRITGTIVAPHDDKYLSRMTTTYYDSDSAQ